MAVWAPPLTALAWALVAPPLLGGAYAHRRLVLAGVLGGVVQACIGVTLLVSLGRADSGCREFGAGAVSLSRAHDVSLSHPPPDACAACGPACGWCGYVGFLIFLSLLVCAAGGYSAWACFALAREMATAAVRGVRGVRV